jgi:hypothetical protein
METPKHGEEPQQAELTFAQPKPKRQSRTQKAAADSPDRYADERSELKIRRIATFKKLLEETPLFKSRMISRKGGTHESPTSGNSEGTGGNDNVENDASSQLDLMIEEEKSVAATKEKKGKGKTLGEKVKNLEQEIQNVKKKKLDALLSSFSDPNDIDTLITMLSEAKEGKGLKRKRTAMNDAQTVDNDEA